MGQTMCTAVPSQRQRLSGLPKRLHRSARVVALRVTQGQSTAESRAPVSQLDTRINKARSTDNVTVPTRLHRITDP